MPDREKVIKGLECCIDPLKARCPECPYYPCYDEDTSSEKLLADALALLKAQETRIMSREEIENADGYFWFEDKAQRVMEARYFRKGILFEIGCLPFTSKKLNWETYGTLWRYWTAMPTEGQRKAVMWDGNEQA